MELAISTNQTRGNTTSTRVARIMTIQGEKKIKVHRYELLPPLLAVLTAAFSFPRLQP